MTSPFVAQIQPDGRQQQHIVIPAPAQEGTTENAQQHQSSSTLKYGVQIGVIMILNAFVEIGLAMSALTYGTDYNQFSGLIGGFFYLVTGAVGSLSKYMRYQNQKVIGYFVALCFLCIPLAIANTVYDGIASAHFGMFICEGIQDQKCQCNTDQRNAAIKLRRIHLTTSVTAFVQFILAIVGSTSGCRYFWPNFCRFCRYRSKPVQNIAIHYPETSQQSPQNHPQTGSSDDYTNIISSIPAAEEPVRNHHQQQRPNLPPNHPRTGSSDGYYTYAHAYASSVPAQNQDFAGDIQQQRPGEYYAPPKHPLIRSSQNEQRPRDYYAPPVLSQRLTDQQSTSATPQENSSYEHPYMGLIK